jgi:hypothetical protein
MWKRRRSYGAGSELDQGLRAHRAEARNEFVDELTGRVLAQRPHRRPAWSRIAFAGAVSTFVLGTFASFGGLSYAASGATGTYHAVKQVAVKHTFIVSTHKSSAASEYPPTPKPPKPPHGVAGGIAGVSSGGTLPFTGLSLLATLIVSLALIAAGVALRRRERSR